MNLAAHILASYLVACSLTADPNLILLGVLFGLIPDLDHLSHTMRAIRTGRYGTESRSRFHELYGLALFSAAIMLLSYAYGNFAVMFFPLLAHYLLDFLTRPTRPFYPFNKTIMHFSLYPKSMKNMIIADILFTGGLLLWIIL